MKAARIGQPNQRSVVQEVEIPKPKDSQVVVKIVESGVCHSDIHLWQGGYEGLGDELMQTPDR